MKKIIRKLYVGSGLRWLKIKTRNKFILLVNDYKIARRLGVRYVIRVKRNKKAMLKDYYDRR